MAKPATAAASAPKPNPATATPAATPAPKTPDRARAEQRAATEALQIKAINECAPKIDALLKEYGLRLGVKGFEPFIGPDGALMLGRPKAVLEPNPAAW